MFGQRLFNTAAHVLKIALIAAIVLGAAPAAPVFAGETIPYIVAPGDNLTRLVERFNSSLLAVLGANKLKSQMLVPGQKLLIPVLAGNIHTVTRGETLLALSTIYGTSIEAIMAANYLSNPMIINGMRLEIPATTPSAPPQTAAPAAADAAAASPLTAAAGGLVADAPLIAEAQAVIVQPQQIASAGTPQTAREQLASSGGLYVVQPLDAINQIAAKFNVPPYVLRRVNKLGANATLRPGQKLTIPAPLGTPYLVQPGESFFGLAQRSGTDILSIMALNGMTIPLIMERSEIALPPQCLTPGVSADPGTRGFAWPTTYMSGSGNKYSKRHRGYDVTAPAGTPVYASKGGVVALAQWTQWGFGNTIVLDHAKEWQTLYAHLASIAVTCGQTVAKGDLLGISGSTGNSTGPHLHFEIMQRQSHVDPAEYLPGA